MPFIMLVIGLFILYCFCLLPRYQNRKSWQEFAKYHYAHRGLHNKDIPENTLAAFQSAIDHGYGFELDVQRTKDNVLVVMHDFDLKRACNVDKKVSELNYDELKELYVFNSNQHIPLFSEVLALVKGQVPLIVEIKQNDNDTTNCSLAANHLDEYKGTFCVESFHPYAVRWFKQNRPEWIRGQLAADFSEDDTKSFWLSIALENLLFNVITRPDFVAYQAEDIKMLSFKFFRYILKGNTALWTVRDKATYQNLKQEYPVIIFEDFVI
ncbi:MAG: glycerophosphodiester phosphodiesterase family protein [Erysipelotrichaceae bacterium]|nr:glycerophosphodiester phosphodiesterase family protein [Erysipelotrichaceae bacterium]